MIKYVHIVLFLMLTSVGCLTEDTTSTQSADAGNRNNDSQTPVLQSPPEARIVKSGKSRMADPQVEQELVEQIINATNTRTLKTIPQDATQFAQSPINLSMSLGIVMAGARGNTNQRLADHFIKTGDSLNLHAAFNQLSQRLGNTPDVMFTMEQAIWLPTTINLLPQYLDILAVHYGLVVHLLDSPMASAQAASDWLQARDTSIENDAVETSNIKAGYFITPTLQFNASWQIQFDPDLTTEATFEGLEASSTVQMMTTPSTYQATIKDDGTRIAQLPMKNPQLVMVLMSPETMRWQEWASQLTMAQILDIDGVSSTSAVRLPRVEISSTIAHKQALTTVGLGEMFDLRQANHSGMDGQGKIGLSNIVQHTKIQWTERGINASSETLFVDKSDPSTGANEMVVSFDRPFAFFVIDTRTDLILLNGTVNNPLNLPKDP